MPTKTTSPITLGLYLTETQEHGYYHVHATPVIVGPTLWDLRYADQTGTPHNVPNDRIRNCSGYQSDSDSPLYLENLTVVSQGDHGSNDRRLYGWDVEYRQVYAIDAHRAGRMSKSLTTITRRMEKADEKYGRPSTFGAYIARVADAIGATLIVFPPKTPNGSSYADNVHQFDSIKHGTYRIDRMIETWTAAGRQGVA